MKHLYALIVIIMLLVGCGAERQQISDATAAPSSNGATPTPTLPTPGLAAVGQDGSYLNYGVYQPLDIYSIEGVVQAAPNAVVSQHIDGSSVVTDGTGAGSISGGTSGKNIVRIHVTKIAVTNAYVEKG